MQIFVERTFGIDFIYLDLLFFVIWMILLLRKGYKVEFIIGLLGIVVNFIVDYGFWFNFLGIRTLEGPIDPLLFFIYFSFTYGMIEYSYVAVMFRASENRERLIWTVILYCGWYLSGSFSQVLPLDDTVIHVAREMSTQRIPMIVAIVMGYGILILLKYKWEPLSDLDWKRLVYLYMVGIIVHLGMEVTLAAAGIRPSPLSVLSEFLFNSFLEFNLGIPLLYLFWVYLTNRTQHSES
ncbi:MAG: hypothetical protein ACFFF4_16400 [Candidatus Thorarchaeota archaeon]